MKRSVFLVINLLLLLIGWALFSATLHALPIGH